MNVNQYWQQTFTPNTGAVALSNITFRNFTGSIANAATRPVLYPIANDLFPAEIVVVEGFSMWTEAGSSTVNQISNIYGTGDNVYVPNNGIAKLEPGATPTTYTTAYTITAPPTGWYSTLVMFYLCLC